MMKYLLMTAFMTLLASLPARASDSVDVAIRHADKTQTVFSVEVASDDAARAKGLMFRRKLDAGAGMLFVYDEPGFREFWMKNTYIPLDMLFFDKKGELVFIKANATPKDLTPIGPDREDICAILEINGGQAKRQRIKTGDKLVLTKSSGCLP